MTPEEIDDKASELYWSLSIDTDSAILAPEEEIQKIASIIRQAIEEERNRCLEKVSGEFKSVTLGNDLAGRVTEEDAIKIMNETLKCVRASISGEGDFTWNDSGGRRVDVREWVKQIGSNAGSEPQSG